MTKRFISLFLCLLLVATMLVSCGKTVLDELRDYLDGASRQPEKAYVTLNMYIPTEGAVDEVAVKAMQAEFNKVIEAKYRTRVIFHLVDIASYRQVIDSKIESGVTNIPIPGENLESNVLNDPFPLESANQLDIFVILNESMFNDCMNQTVTILTNDPDAPLKDIPALLDLTTPLRTTYNRTLSNQYKDTCIPELIYDIPHYNGQTAGMDTPDTSDDVYSDFYYGIPANFLIGSYSYYVIHKENAAAHYFSTSDSGIDLQTRINRLIADINNDPQITDKAAYIAETIQLVEGADYRARFEYDPEQYIVEVYESPTLSTSEVYNGMFCIAANSNYQDRALEVLAELYTNKELHTTLQYGAEDVTYTFETMTVTVDGEEVEYTYVALIDGAPAYKINSRYTGNAANIYACAKANGEVDYDFLKYFCLQNKDATMAIE